jgi:hypothetical protein
VKPSFPGLVLLDMRFKEFNISVYVRAPSMDCLSIYVSFGTLKSLSVSV